jgi:hypothetical protein
MDVEALLQALDPSGTCELRRDGYWAVWPNLDVRAMATLMREREVRLATVTGTPGADGDLRVIYHWDAGAELLNMEATVKTGHLPTISDILPAADWAEREIRDYYGIDFDGRAATPPLMLRESDVPGLFSRTRDVGNEIDPAETSRTNTESSNSESEATAETRKGESR